MPAVSKVTSKVSPSEPQNAGDSGVQFSCESNEPSSAVTEAPSSVHVQTTASPTWTSSWAGV